MNVSALRASVLNWPTATRLAVVKACILKSEVQYSNAHLRCPVGDGYQVSMEGNYNDVQSCSLYRRYLVCMAGV